MKTRMRSLTILMFLTVFLFILSPRIAHAATCNWTGSSGDWNDPSHWSCGHVPGPGDDAYISFEMSYQTVTLTEDATVGSLTLDGGTLTGSFDLTAGTINWIRGTMSGNGTTTATNFANFTGTQVISLIGRTFNNAGAATWDRGQSLYPDATAIFNNQAGATFTILSSGANIISGYGTFNNAGTIIKANLGSGTIFLRFINADTGMVSVESGTLVINNQTASSSSGTFNVVSSASLKLTGSAHNLVGNISFTGTGTVEVTGITTVVYVTSGYAFPGTINLTDYGTLNLSTGITVSTGILNMNGGFLTGAGDLTAGTINWIGGDMSGSGTTTATNFANFSGAPVIHLYDRTFNNTGEAIWNKTNLISVNNAGIINNQAGATFTVQSSGSQIVSGWGTFNNYGTLNLRTGRITVTTFKQEIGGITNLAIGGTTPNTNYSQLISANFYLTGPLNISFTSGYTPQIPDHFILLIYSSSRTGDFSPVNITPVPGIHWDLYYQDNSLHLIANPGMISMFIPIIIR
jgi:hypothetical protein